MEYASYAIQNVLHAQTTLDAPLAPMDYSCKQIIVLRPALQPNSLIQLLINVLIATTLALHALNLKPRVV